MRAHYQAKQSETSPFVSVIIPVKDDSDLLKKTIVALETQSLPTQQYEVIFAVSNSRDTTHEVAEKSVREHKNWRVILVGEANRSQARNIAAQESRGEILVFTDAGCYPEPDWLLNILKPFSDPQCLLVSGLTLAERSSEFASAQAPFVLVPETGGEKHPLPSTRNMALRRSIFEQTGGFCDRLTYAEDYEYSRRLRQHGIQAVFVPPAKVLWQPRASLLAFFLMMHKLTAGDMLAGTPRLGQLTMWLRYSALMLFFLLEWRFLGFAVAFQMSLLILLIYLLGKTARIASQGWSVSTWTPVLQLVTDVAVLSGTLQGAVWKVRPA